MQMSWKKARLPLIGLWALAITLCALGSYFSLEERYNDQERLMRRALMLQRKLVAWQRFLDKEPKEKASIQWIHHLEKMPLMEKEKALLEQAKSHPLVENEAKLKLRLNALENNHLAFDIGEDGKCSLRQGVDMNAQDLENLLSALENEMQKAPFEISKFKIERSAERLEGEVFELKQLELTL